MMSVIDPVVEHLKYEMDWALASLCAKFVPITVFPKEVADPCLGVGVGVGVVVGVGVWVAVGVEAVPVA